MPIVSISTGCYYLNKHIYNEEYYFNKEKKERSKNINNNIDDAKFIYEQNIKDIVPIIEYYNITKKNIYDAYPDLTDNEKEMLILSIVKIKYD